MWFEAVDSFPTFIGIPTRNTLNRLATLFTGLVLAHVLVACQQPTPAPPSPAENMTQYILGDSGVFRGHQLGDLLNEMAEQDRDYLFARNTDELRYSIPFSTSDSAHFDVLYAFRKNHLYEIQVDILLNSAVDSLFMEMKRSLTRRYGTPHERGEYAFWETTQRGRDVEFSLRDESEMRGRPYLSYNIFEPQIFVH